MQSVTVLTSNTSLYGFAAALEGIEEATRDAGFAMGVRVVESGTLTDVPGRCRAGHRARGRADRDRLRPARHRGPRAAVPSDVPVAAIVETPSGDEAEGKPWVWIDDRVAAKEATNYLLSLGHRTVHHLSIPTWTGTSRRMSGWRSALEEAQV